MRGSNEINETFFVALSYRVVETRYLQTFLLVFFPECPDSECQITVIKQLDLETTQQLKVFLKQRKAPCNSFALNKIVQVLMSDIAAWISVHQKGLSEINQ